MSCNRYFEQDNCPYYPLDCANCEQSYSYTDDNTYTDDIDTLQELVSNNNRVLETIDLLNADRDILYITYDYFNGCDVFSSTDINDVIEWERGYNNSKGKEL